MSYTFKTHDENGEVTYTSKTREEVLEYAEHVLKIVPERTLKRDALDGEMLFLVENKDGELEYNVPFTSLVVLGVYVHDELINTLINMVEKAREYPNHKRHCLITGRKTVRGTLFCKAQQKYQQYIEEQISS